MTIFQDFKKVMLRVYWKFLSLVPLFFNYIEILNQKKLSKFNKVLGVYDYNSYTSPYSIGDYLCYLFFYKIFFIYNKKISIFIICDQEKKFDNFKKKILKTQVSLTKKLLNKHLIKIKVITWKQFQNEELKEYYSPYRNDVINRKDIRSKFVSMFNIKLKNISTKKLNDFLIKENDFDSFKSKLPKKFVAWHIRHNPEWASHRNISESEFLELYKILREKIKKIPIIIISDQRGCFFAKKISKKNKLELIFCKDISKSIYSDFFIIIKSNLFFCFKAGGMLVIPWFSKKNFIWGGTIGLKNQFSSGRSFSFDKLHFWQTDKQYWINSSGFWTFKDKVKEINFKKFGL